MAQDVIQRPDRIRDVWAFVEHHALRALARGGVGDLGSRGLPGLPKVSSTWVAQMAGTWAASDRARIWRGTSEMRSNP